MGTHWGHLTQTKGAGGGDQGRLIRGIDVSPGSWRKCGSEPGDNWWKGASETSPWPWAPWSRSWSRGRVGQREKVTGIVRKSWDWEKTVLKGAFIKCFWRPTTELTPGNPGRRPLWFLTESKANLNNQGGSWVSAVESCWSGLALNAMRSSCWVSVCSSLQLPGRKTLIGQVGHVCLSLDQSGMGKEGAYGQSYLDPVKPPFSSVFFVLLCF